MRSILICLFLITLACSKKEDEVVTQSQILILNQGHTHASLARYQPEGAKLEPDIFVSSNHIRLSSTALNMFRYREKLYIVLNKDRKIEVTNLSGKLLGTIYLGADVPQFIAFHDDKMYVSTQQGMLFQYAINTLAKLAQIEVGAGASHLCISQQKLYVSLEGVATKNNKIAVVNLSDFKLLTQITVGETPQNIISDAYKNIYVVTAGKPSNLYRISTLTDQVDQVYNIPAQGLSIYNDSAYVYHFNPQNNLNSIKVFNIQTGDFSSHDFLNHYHDVKQIIGLSIDQATGNFYIMDQPNATGKGIIHCLNANKDLLFTIPDVGERPQKLFYFP